MKRKEVKILLKILDSDHISDSEFKVFSNPEEARMKYAELKYLHENAGSDQFSFSPFFKEKVMRQIYEISKAPAFDEVLSRFMNSVMISGAITIVIVLLLLFAYHGQLGIDTLTGIEQDDTMNFISSLFNEY